MLLVQTTRNINASWFGATLTSQQGSSACSLPVSEAWAPICMLSKDIISEADEFGFVSAAAPHFQPGEIHIIDTRTYVYMLHGAVQSTSSRQRWASGTHGS